MRYKTHKISLNFLFLVLAFSACGHVFTKKEKEDEPIYIEPEVREHTLTYVSYSATAGFYNVKTYFRSPNRNDIKLRAPSTINVQFSNEQEKNLHLQEGGQGIGHPWFYYEGVYGTEGSYIKKTDPVSATVTWIKEDGTRVVDVLPAPKKADLLVDQTKEYLLHPRSLDLSAKIAYEPLEPQEQMNCQFSFERNESPNKRTVINVKPQNGACILGTDQLQKVKKIVELSLTREYKTTLPDRQGTVTTRYSSIAAFTITD